MLEAQRELTGDDRELNRAVDTVLLVLREKLARLQAEPGDKNQHQLAVLIADLSGYTALSERMDVERVRDAINAMWGVLDAVVHSWGGQIDQHAGDSLMALFGLPHSRQGDAGRALHAALSMQQELALFNERARRAAEDPADESWVGEWPGPNMRIGVHSGPVFFARSQGISRTASGRAAAVGETVAVARRLEKLAPAGGVLTSRITQQQARSDFHFAAAPEFATSLREDDEVYLVRDERPMDIAYTPGMVAGKVSRLVGRTALQDRLQLALQAATDSDAPYLVTIVGAPGAGKSRLVHEFEDQARLMTGSPAILRTGTQGAFADFPYALIRDMLLRQFSIRPQHSRYLIDARLRQGLSGLVTSWGEDSLPGSYTEAQALLERLLDAKTAASIPLEDVLSVVEPLLKALTAGGPTICIIEGINRADRQSLELVDRLVHRGKGGPLLFLGLATVAEATDPEQILPWLGRKDDMFAPVERLDIPPLSPVDSRLMATGILSSLSPLPMRLLDLVVAEAEGNPLYIEAFIRLLIERGVITAGDRWRVDMDQAEKSSMPPGLTRLIAAQLAYLSPPERRVLQYAAIFGPLCWDTGLLELIPEDEIDSIEVEAALLSLVLKGYLVKDDVYSFAASQAYAFRRDTVREAVYAELTADERRRLHLEAANWLIATQNNTRLGAWFAIDSIIARHFNAAGETGRANHWRQRAEVPGLGR